VICLAVKAVLMDRTAMFPVLTVAVILLFKADKAT